MGWFSVFYYVSAFFWSADVHLWDLFSWFGKIVVGRYISVFNIGLADISDALFCNIFHFIKSYACVLLFLNLILWYHIYISALYRSLKKSTSAEQYFRDFSNCFTCVLIFFNSIFRYYICIASAIKKSISVDPYLLIYQIYHQNIILNLFWLHFSNVFLNLFKWNIITELYIYIYIFIRYQP